MDTFGHVVVWAIYTSHIAHFTPQHTAFEQSTACLSVFLESLPGLIPFTILWHAGWTLEKKQLHEHEHFVHCRPRLTIFVVMPRYIIFPRTISHWNSILLLWSQLIPQRSSGNFFLPTPLIMIRYLIARIYEDSYLDRYFSSVIKNAWSPSIQLP